MKAGIRGLAIAAGLILATVWWHSRTPGPTILSFRPGQAFEGVVKDSTFPVLARSNIPDSDTGWGATWVTEPAVIIRLNDSEHGFTLPPTKFAALSYLARSGVRFVNRQPGSGTRMLLEMMLAADGPPPESINGFNSAEFTHSAVAACIASGMADAGFGMRAAAAQFELDFLPPVREQYYFALRRDALEEPRMRQLIDLMRTPAYHALVAALPGYDAAHTGEVAAIEDAFALHAGTGADHP